MCYAVDMERIAIRELRNHASRVVRRAHAGERIIITVDGIPTAQIVPLDATSIAATLDDLVSQGRLPGPPHRHRAGACRADGPGRRPLAVRRRAGAARQMTFFLDTSALVKRYRREDGTPRVLSAMSDDPVWVVSAVVRTEAELALCTAIPESDRSTLIRRLIGRPRSLSRGPGRPGVSRSCGRIELRPRRPDAGCAASCCGRSAAAADHVPDVRSSPGRGGGVLGFEQLG